MVEKMMIEEPTNVEPMTNVNVDAKGKVKKEKKEIKKNKKKKSKELVNKKNENIIPKIDEKIIKDYIFSKKADLTEEQQKLAIAIAVRNNLDPFKREIHFYTHTERETGKKRLTVVTGYEVYLKRAERIRMLDGWCIKTEGSCKDGSLKAIITIYRKDWSHPFIHEVYYREVKGRGPIWMQMPVFMTKKVAIAQGFRLAFPDEMGGMPYIIDEIPIEGKIVEGEIVNNKNKAETVKPEPAKKVIDTATDEQIIMIKTALKSRFMTDEEKLNIQALLDNNMLDKEKASTIITWWYGNKDKKQKGVRHIREDKIQNKGGNNG